MPDQFQFNGPIYWTQFIIILQFNKTVTYQFLGWFEPILSFDGKVAILTPLIFTWQNNNKYLKFKKERKKEKRRKWQMDEELNRMATRNANSPSQNLEWTWRKMIEYPFHLTRWFWLTCVFPNWGNRTEV